MSARRPLIIAVSALAWVAIPMSAAFAGPWNLAPGEYYSELSGSFFSAGSWYDDGAHRLPLGGLDEQRQMHFTTELGWKKHTSFQFDLPVVSQTGREDNPAGSLTNTGYGDVGLGLRYGLHQGPGAAAIQIRWELPSGLNPMVSPLLTDGTQKLEADLELGSHLGHRAFYQLGGGYRYDYRTIGARKQSEGADVLLSGPPVGANSALAADHDWADHTVAEAALGIWLGGNLQVAGQYRGEFAGATGRPYKTETQLAGPRVTYRVDDRLDAFAGSWHTPTGKNTLHVDEYYVGFAWKQTKLNRLQGFLGGAKRP